MAGVDTENLSAGRGTWGVWRRIPTGLALFCFGLAVYVLTLPADLRNNADTVDRFFVTRALVHHRLSVQCGGIRPADARLVAGVHGCYYAIYGPGQTLLMTPLYVVGKGLSAVTALGSIGAQQAHEALVTAVAARMLDPLLGALVLVLFFLLTAEAGYRRSTGIALTLALALASTVWPDVQGGQEQIQVTMALLAMIYAGLRAGAARPIDRGKWLVACGAAAGFGILTRYDFAIDIGAGLGFAAWWLWRSRLVSRWDPAALARPLFLGFLPFLVIDALWNALRFGAPWRVGQVVGDQFGTTLWYGVISLLISPGKGLIWYLPLLWLAPFGWSRFRDRAPGLSWLILALLACSLLFYGVVKYWHGDPAWGPRYLFPVVPLLLLPLGEIFQRFRSFRLPARGAVLAIVGLSFLVQLGAVSVDPWRFWYHLIEKRQTAGQVFMWYPSTYNYYWSSDPTLSPLIYQVAAVVDVVRIAGDDRHAIPEASASALQRCGSVLPALVRRFDQCKLDGLSQRPLNTISPIWLNDRYQFVDAGPFPLQLAWRISLLGLLLVMATACAAVLHIQFWSDASTSPKR